MKTEATMSQKVQAECPRCFGRGVIEAFSGHANGRCFLCWGAGRVEVDVVTAEKAARVRIGGLLEDLTVSVLAGYSPDASRHARKIAAEIEAGHISRESVREVLRGWRQTDLSGCYGGSSREAIMAARAAVDLVCDAGRVMAA